MPITRETNQVKWCGIRLAHGETALPVEDVNNRVKRITPDLNIARTAKKLSDTTGGEGLFTYYADGWYYLKVVTKGTGTWTLDFVFDDDSTETVTSAEVEDGDEFILKWADLQLTNASQSVTDPKFWLERRA